jgi:HK97 family phage major capsid protein
MSDYLKRKVEEQNKLFNRMQEIQRVAEEEERDWTAEERTNWDAANTRIDEVSADIERLERQAKRDAPSYEGAIQATGSDNPEETPEERATKRGEAYQRAFSDYLVRGIGEMDVEQRRILARGWQADSETRALGESSNTAGGYTVPPGFRNVMSETLKAYGGLLNVCNVITTDTGNPLQWPTNNDTGNVGSLLSENTQISALDMTFGTRTMNAWKYTSGLVLVSWELLNDSAFDLAGWLPGMLGTRIGRAVAAHLVAGSGSSQPTGVTNGITIGKTGLTGQTATVIYDDLVDLEHSIDPAYRNGNVRYVMNDTTLRVLRKLKDTQGRPLWVPVPTVGFPATLNGIPYTIDQGMPTMAANAVSILFGDFHAGYIVRQVHDVQLIRLNERYADFQQVGFFGYSRLDGRPNDPAAIAAYKNSAT